MHDTHYFFVLRFQDITGFSKISFKEFKDIFYKFQDNPGHTSFI